MGFIIIENKWGCDLERRALFGQKLFGILVVDNKIYCVFTMHFDLLIEELAHFGECDPAGR